MRPVRMATILATLTGLLLAGCGSGGSTGSGGGNLPLTRTRTYQVSGSSGAELAVVVDPGTGARQSGTVSVHVTSLDGLFFATAATLTSQTATRLAGSIKTTTGVDCLLVIVFTDTAGNQVQVTVTGTGVSFSGSGTGTDGEHGLDLTTGSTQGAVASLVGLATAFGQTVQSLGSGLPADPSALPEGTTTVAGCPRATYVRTGQTVAVRVDYGTTGCGTAGTVVGAVTATLNLTTKTGTGTFDQFAVNGHAVNGTFSVTLGGTAAHRSYDLTVDLAVVGQGQVVGSASGITSAADGAWSIPSGTLDLTVASTNTTYRVTVAGLVVNPKVNHNAMPQAGTLTLKLPVPGPFGLTLEVPVVVTFTSQSPVTGQVSVKVANQAAHTVTIPL